jgi:hypothetical protein
MSSTKRQRSSFNAATFASKQPFQFICSVVQLPTEVFPNGLRGCIRDLGFDPFFEFQKKWLCRSLHFRQRINNGMEI